MALTGDDIKSIASEMGRLLGPIHDQLEEHTAILKEHSVILNDHTQKLDQIERKIDSHTTSLDRLEGRVRRLEDHAGLRQAA